MPNDQDNINQNRNNHNWWAKVFKWLKILSYNSSNASTAISIGSSEFNKNLSSVALIIANIGNDTFSIAKNAETVAKTLSHNNNKLSPKATIFIYSIIRLTFLCLILAFDITALTTEKQNVKWFKVAIGILMIAGQSFHIPIASILTRKFKASIALNANKEKQIGERKIPTIYAGDDGSEEYGTDNILEIRTGDDWLDTLLHCKNKIEEEQNIIDDLTNQLAQLNIQLNKRRTRQTQKNLDKTTLELAEHKKNKTFLLIASATEKSTLDSIILRNSFHRAPRNNFLHPSQTKQALITLLSDVTSESAIQIYQEIAKIEYGENCDIIAPDLMSGEYSITNPLVIPARIVKPNEEITEFNNWVVLYVDPINRKAFYFDPYYESNPPPQNIHKLLDSKYGVEKITFETITPNNLKYGHQSIAWIAEFVRMIKPNIQLSNQEILEKLANISIITAQSPQRETPPESTSEEATFHETSMA